MNLVQNGIMTGTETTEFFSDGIGSVHVTGNLVRIDFVTLQPHLQGAAESEGKPVFAVKHRCVMPLESFIQSLSVQEDIVQKLMAKGVVQKLPAVEPAIETPAATSPTPQQRKGSGKKSSGDGAE